MIGPETVPETLVF